MTRRDSSSTIAQTNKEYEEKEEDDDDDEKENRHMCHFRLHFRRGHVDLISSVFGLS